MPAQPPAEPKKAPADQAMMAPKANRFLVGDQVNYNSTRHGCWVPAIVTYVDPETGNIGIDMRSTPINAEDVATVLRESPRPTLVNLQWVRRTLLEGRVLAEAERLFLDYCEAGPLLSSFNDVAVGDYVIAAENIRCRYECGPHKDYNLDRDSQGKVVLVRLNGDLRIDWGPRLGHKWVLPESVGKIARCQMHPEGMKHAGEEMDSFMGAGGSTYELRRRSLIEMTRKVVPVPGWQAFRAQDGAVVYRNGAQERHDWPGDAPFLTFTVFREAFWEMLMDWQNKWAFALSKEQFIPKRRQGAGREYVEVKHLGEGGFGSVSLMMHHPTGSKRAVKSIARSKNRGSPENAEFEIEHLVSLDHPNIVKLYDYWRDEQCFYLAMDYCSGGDLRSAYMAHKQSQLCIVEPIVVDIMRQIFRAVSHIHAHGLLHLDLKGANVMLSPEADFTLPPCSQRKEEANLTPGLLSPCRAPHIMVIDFGLARIFKPGKLKNRDIVGTPTTMAPEAWQAIYSPAADVFSCGVIFFQLLTLASPFWVPMTAESAIAYYKGNPEFRNKQLWRGSHACREAFDLCERMLAMHRLDRPSAAQCLQDAYFGPVQLGRRAGPQKVQGRGTPPPRPIVPFRVWQRWLKVPTKSLLHRSVALALAGAWPADRLPTVKRAFQELDTCCIGRLTKDQIERALCMTGVPADVIATAADAMDLTRDGMINWTEFVACCIHLGSSALDEDLQRVFQEADKNHDGYLDRADLERLLGAECLPEDVDGVLEQMVGACKRKGEAPAALVDFPTFRRHFISADMQG